MDECFVPVMGGGGKVITEGFKTEGQNLVLPPGITWGDIKYFSCLVAESYRTTIQHRFKEIGGERLCYTDYQNAICPVGNVQPTDTEIPLGIDFGGLSLRYVIAVV